MQIELYPSLGDLPLFNPDLETAPPQHVLALRSRITASDALLIASPEYAHGVSGVIKNALDWLVSFEPFVHMPVAVLNASPRAHHADEALRETLMTMSARVCDAASITIPLLGAGLQASTIIQQSDLAEIITAALVALMRAGTQKAHDAEAPKHQA